MRQIMTRHGRAMAQIELEDLVGRSLRRLPNITRSTGVAQGGLHRLYHRLGDRSGDGRAAGARCRARGRRGSAADGECCGHYAADGDGQRAPDALPDALRHHTGDRPVFIEVFQPDHKKATSGWAGVLRAAERGVRGGGRDRRRAGNVRLIPRRRSLSTGVAMGTGTVAMRNGG